MMWRASYGNIVIKNSCLGVNLAGSKRQGWERKSAETAREEFESVFLCIMPRPGLFEIKSKHHSVRLQKMEAVVVRSRF
jgi:hypothetical protein